jgi:hypothetical protein
MRGTTVSASSSRTTHQQRLDGERAADPIRRGQTPKCAKEGVARFLWKCPPADVRRVGEWFDRARAEGVIVGGGGHADV